MANFSAGSRLKPTQASRGMRQAEMLHDLDCVEGYTYTQINIRCQSKSHMNLIIQPEPIPIAIKEDGVARIAGTRVTLDTVVGAFNDGASAEEIAQQYPSLELSDVYAVITYYLREKAAVDAYLDEYHQRGEQIRQEVEARFNAVGIRERLMARRTQGR
jgi:uncharacterized protein (DUF433 family)